MTHFDDLANEYGQDANDWDLIGKLFSNIHNEAAQQSAFREWLQGVPQDQLADRLQDVKAKIEELTEGQNIFTGYSSLDITMNGDKVQDVALTFNNPFGPAVEWITMGTVNYSTDLYDPGTRDLVQ